MLLRSFLAACALAVLAIAPAHASLIGATVDISSPHGTCLDVVVGAGVECAAQDAINVIDVDVGASSIVFTFRGSSGFFLWGPDPIVFDIVIDGLNLVEDPAAAIASIVVTPETFGSVLLGSIGATLTGPNQVTMAFGDLIMTNCNPTCARLTVDLTFAETSDAPEPATLALVGVGLAGLAYAKRRRT